MKYLKSYVCILSMLLLITGMSITSCTEDFGPEIDKLKEDVSNLKTSVDKLKEAYEGGKIITGVEPIITAEGGWKITFSDNSAITIQNGSNGKDGSDGVTPYIKIDNNCNWVVSYDNGQTYTLIKDAEGNPVNAKGINGGGGISVEVQVNSEGNYEIITYIEDKSNPISILPTPYSANPDNQITSIVEDSERGMVTITMSSGKQYNFGQSLNYPTSIVLLNEEYVISEESGTAEIEFYINPSNAKITKEDIVINQIEADILKSYAETYANPSPNYEIVSLENSENEKGEQLQGRYKLTIKHIGESGLYGELCTLVISTKDAQDNKIEITSEKFILISDIYSLTVHVILPDLINWSDIEEASVVAVNKYTEETFELSEVSDGVYKTVEITEGEYEVNVSFTALDGGIFGSTIVYVDNAQTAAIETEYVSKLIIKEFYSAMCKTPANESYQYDQFVEIYNNSPFTQYLDNCLIARTETAANAKYVFWGTTPQDMKAVAVSSYVAGFVGDGTGKKYPIEPGKSVVVAFQAQDHRNIGNVYNPNTVDLSKADYEIDITEYNTSYVANPDVPNLTIVAKPGTQTINFGILPAFGAGLVLAKVDDIEAYCDVNNEANWVTKPEGTDVNPYLMIRYEDIQDAINVVCVTETQRRCALPAEIDAGMIWTSAMHNGMGFTRKVSHIAPNGRVVYQDTNNSYIDFESEAKPTPGY